MAALECLMSSPIAPRIVLVAHPSSASDAIHTLQAQFEVTAAGPTTVSFFLEADVSRLLIPSEAQPHRADGLWKHSCFEFFIAPHGSSDYFEFNFSPSRQWAAYQFDGYRQGMRPLPLKQMPQVSVRSTDARLELTAVLQLPTEIAGTAGVRARLAVAAVIEEDNGRLSYWAARHAAGKPDFHHPDAFAVEL
jgi:hypothetical protein